MQWLAYLLVGLILSLVPFVAKASEPLGLAMYNAELNAYTQAPGIASDIFIDVNGITARTHVVQYFFNDTDHWQEGVYTYPLPESASVDKLVMVIGDRRVLGFVAQKDKAKKMYEQAKKQGKAAGLVEHHRPNLFRNSIANIPPRSLVAVEIAYQHDVAIDQRNFSLRLPMAITPRFDNFDPQEFVHLASNEISQTQLSDLEERLSLMNYDDGSNPVRLQIRLDAGFEAFDVKSTSHKVQVSEIDAQNFKIMTDQDILAGEQDFILEWSAPDNNEILSFVHQESLHGDVYTQIVVMPPADEFVDETLYTSPKRQVVFVLDTSGSMQGPSIQQAKSAIREALYDLNEQDVFNIVHFNSYSEKLFMNSVKASAYNVQKALRWVNMLSADGGTQMLPALEHAFDELNLTGYLQQIVFITDGAVGYESKLSSYIRQNIGEARFFSVGIGSAPNTHLMQIIAESGRGIATFIHDVRQTKEKMSDLFAKMKRPALTDLALDGLPEGVRVVPAVLPDLLYGQPLSVVMRSANPPSTLVLKAKRGDQNWMQSLNVRSAQHASGVSKIYARRKIKQMQVENRQDAFNISEMTQLALKHQIVSSFTSLVAIDEKEIRPENATILPKRYHSNLPKGWQLAEFDPQDVIGRYNALQNERQKITLPRTDTGYVMCLLLGFLMMILAWIGLMVGEKRYA